MEDCPTRCANCQETQRNLGTRPHRALDQHGMDGAGNDGEAHEHRMAKAQIRGRIRARKAAIIAAPNRAHMASTPQIENAVGEAKSSASRKSGDW